MRKTVVITGASSGIGRATAHEFAREGASLVLASRQKDALDEVVAECVELGGSAIAVATDVSDSTEVAALARAAIDTYGHFDVWVNNASVSAYGSLLDIPLDDVRRVLDVNVLGYVYGTREALKAFERTGTGAIVNVASLVGEIPQPYSAPYSMAEAAVLALGTTVRQELALARQKGISISTVLPSTIDTPFFRHAANYSGRELTAMPPVYPPEVAAKAIVRAASKPRSEIVVGASGKRFVRRNRRHLREVNARKAMQANPTRLSRKRGTETTSGNLYKTPDDASVTGGWDGASRHMLRKAILGTLMVGGGALVTARLVRQGVGQRS